MDDVSRLSDAELADSICTWAGRIAAGEAHLLLLIGEFDRRQAWGGPGMLSCAHWLSWRTGTGLVAARERVRVAKALRTLPHLQEAMAAGHLSWTQVRAITRVATPDDGIDWCSIARHASGAQLEAICRGVRRVQRTVEDEADPELAQHRMRTTKRYDQDGSLVITIRVDAEDGAVVLAGLDAVKADLDRRSTGRDAAPCEDDSAESSATAAPTRPTDDRSTSPTAATDADALLELARRALDDQRQRHPDVGRRTRARITALVDPLSGWARLSDGELLPPSSLRHVLRSLPGRAGLLRLRPVTAADLTRADLGRSARHPDLRLRELLGALDGECCRFPGCTRRHRLHAHHVVHWSAGGPTDLGNLLLLCGRHHTLAHQQGFQLVLRDDRRLFVRTADGVAVLHRPGLPWGDRADLDRPGHVAAATLPPEGTDGRIDLRYVVSVLVQQAA